MTYNLWLFIILEPDVACNDCCVNNPYIDVIIDDS